MTAVEENLPPPIPLPATNRQRIIFLAIVIGVILAAVLRSSLATRLDGFTMDEAYHITAGVSYWRTGDYRLNPEHPPLVKLWIGAALSGSVFRLPEFRPLQDKTDERTFTDTKVFLENDPDRLQSRARIAMLGFSALLLFCFALAARRVLGSTIAVSTLAFLAVDPTVAAHMPVVMTDLAVALLSATALLWAVVAFRTWKVRDLLLATLLLGLTLAAKHSGLITLAAVAVLGVGLAIFSRSGKGPHCSGARAALRRLSMVVAVLVGALTLLWGFYRFRFDESPKGRDAFNRPMAEKISDLRSPVFSSALQAMSKAHVLPRAYIWGLADTVRAAIEGRVDNLFCIWPAVLRPRAGLFLPRSLAGQAPVGVDPPFSNRVLSVRNRKSGKGRADRARIRRRARGPFSDRPWLRQGLWRNPARAAARSADGTLWRCCAEQGDSNEISRAARNSHAGRGRGVGLGHSGDAAVGVLQRTDQRRRKCLPLLQRRRCRPRAAVTGIGSLL